MPVEIVMIILVSIIAGTGAVVAVAKIIAGAVEGRRQPASGSSLTSAELARMIGETVEEANRPIRKQLELLQRQLGPAEEAKLLKEPDRSDDR